MRSVVVVLPASMWAMIPMFRTRSSAMRVAVVLIAARLLPAVVREGLVRLRHPVDVVLLLERATLAVDRIHELCSELLVQPLLAALARELDEPADRERARPALRHLDGHLVVGAAHATAAHLEDGRDRLHGLLERLDGRLAGLLGDDRERVVDEPLGDRLLPVEHDGVDQLRDELRAVDRIDLELARRDVGPARHYERLAPYFERPCLRSETPAVSSAARMTLYRMPGRSLTRPPRISTTECSCRLWPSPGMYDVTSLPLVSRTRATLRSAEFGFFGVVVYTRVQTPRRCGAATFFLRPLPTSWEVVGIRRETVAAA